MTLYIKWMMPLIIDAQTYKARIASPLETVAGSAPRGYENCMSVPSLPTFNVGITSHC
jgi:hypothetical protein